MQGTISQKSKILILTAILKKTFACETYVGWLLLCFNTNQSLTLSAVNNGEKTSKTNEK